VQTDEETLKRLTNWNGINATLNADLNELYEWRDFLIVQINPSGEDME
jgi:hypothetical protein